ncbi:GntR family transcriptional regulator [Alteribacillus sp. HJP-4]|uniref:GntR family transcriptional regulator n=1 Tax=Alteribacillus sp. HJP-4 TaxID=2775394 RepID=UPI0035CD0CF4
MTSRQKQFFSGSTASIKSLRETAAEAIREAIILGHFKPGDAIREREVSEWMKISTTPVKEALRVLEYEGMVVTKPRKGTFVSNIVHTSIEEVFLLRAAVEGLCARLAAVKMADGEIKSLEIQLEKMDQLIKENKVEALVEENTAFHQKIIDGAKSPLVQKNAAGVAAFDHAFRKKALQNDEEQIGGFQEHWMIYQAIADRDGARAEAEMKQHITRTLHHVLSKEGEER